MVGALRADVDFVSLPLLGRGQASAAYLQHLRQLLELSQAELLIASPRDEKLLRELGVDRFATILSARECVDRGETLGRLRDHLGQGRLIQMTSGTTGVPKGVCLDGHKIAACVEATLDIIAPPGSPYRGCYWVPLSHDMGLIGSLFCSWAAACKQRAGIDESTYVCLSPERFMARPLAWLELCARFGATTTAGPTFAYRVAARQLAATDMRLDLSSLRTCIVGAEPVYAEVLRDFAAAALPHGFNERALCPAYGLAEAALTVSMSRPGVPWYARAVSESGPDSTGVSRSVVSCGPVLPCLEVCSSEEAAGRILLRGASAAQDFLPTRQRAPDEWLDTGDLGAIIDGDLFVTGRGDDLICVAGRNLFAWELEGKLAGQALVRPGNCAMVADQKGGYLVLFEPAKDTVPTSELQEACTEVRRALVVATGIGPSFVACVPRGTLPKTSSGKLRRRHIAQTWETLAQASLASRRS
jgi:fatty-acyl-CoA synthase